MTAIVSATSPVVTVSSDQTFSYKGVEVSTIAVIDLLDPSITDVELSATGEDSLKSILGPSIRYIIRDYPTRTINLDGATISVNEVGDVDWSGMNTYHVYTSPVIPTIMADVPGESGNIMLIRCPHSMDSSNLMDLNGLMAATDSLYMYTDDGIIHIDPQTNTYTLWGGFDPGDYNPDDFGATLAATEVDLDAFVGDASLGEMMGTVYPQTLPEAGEYVCYIMRYEPETSTIVILGMAPVIIMDGDRSLTWNGSTDPGTWDEGDAMLGFEGGNNLVACAYLIVKENAVFDCVMSINEDNLAALKDHPMPTVSCLIDFLKQQVPGHTYAESPIIISLIVDGEEQTPGDLNSMIPISTGYGVAGADTGNEVVVPASVLGGLNDGTYLVILLGVGASGDVVALDQAVVGIGSTTVIDDEQSATVANEGGDDPYWSRIGGGEKGLITIDDGASLAEIEGSDSSDENGAGTVTATGAASVRDINGGTEAAAAAGAAPADTVIPSDAGGSSSAAVGYTLVGLIVLGAAGLTLNRYRFR
ncbi:hypothetical protein [Methanofollis fontis]|nr:hypothetical protein [Methanofollis fontis]